MVEARIYAQTGYAELPNVRIQPRALGVGCNARLGLVPYGSSIESPKPAYTYLSPNTSVKARKPGSPVQ
jgi:hypothetical protein